jgi:uncharacterized protein with FMN-binding domain
MSTHPDPRPTNAQSRQGPAEVVSVGLHAPVQAPAAARTRRETVVRSSARTVTVAEVVDVVPDATGAAKSVVVDAWNW